MSFISISIILARIEHHKRRLIMRNFIFGILTLLFALMIIGTYWNTSARKDYQLQKYQEEIVSRDKEIRGLEDSIAILIDRMEFYEITWEVLRGIDSSAVKGLFHYIWKVREIENNYEDLEYIKSKSSIEPFLSCTNISYFHRLF